MTSFPLYVPQEEQTRWGSLGALHWGQTEEAGAVRKSWALLMFFRDLEVFFLGTAMMVLLLRCYREIFKYAEGKRRSLPAAAAVNGIEVRAAGTA